MKNFLITLMAVLIVACVFAGIPLIPAVLTQFIYNKILIFEFSELPILSFATWYGLFAILGIIMFYISCFLPRNNRRN